jgi:SAM-dependent methyltransferase
VSASRPAARKAGSPSPVCILCGTDAAGRDLFPGILKCPSCGFVFANTQISPKELNALYQRNYFFGEEYVNYIEDKATLQRNFAERLRTLKNFSSGGRLFEIGCAYGFFLELAENSWTAEGCDISKDAAQAARTSGLKVTFGDFLKLPSRRKSYDVVCMWDTIEHLARPDLYVEKAASLLRAGGVLSLTTGDIGSWMARFRKSRWRLIHPPTHLYYFDRRTITTLLSRYGLQVVNFEHCGYYRSLQQILYSILILNRKGKAGKSVYEMLKPLFGINMYANLFDIMFVVARKI